MNSSDQMASWSNWDVASRRDADDVDLAAPGVGVLSYYKNGELASLNGTSMAAPHVAGLLLLAGVSAGPLATPVVSGSADPFAQVSDSLAAGPAGGGSSGGDGAQILWGTSASDSITGGGDTFLLGDGRGSFYLGGSSRNLGTGDTALILDFDPLAGDRVQLRQGLSFLGRNTNLGGIATTEIYLSDGNGVLGNGDDLIAQLKGVALISGSGPVALGADQSWLSFA